MNKIEFNDYFLPDVKIDNFEEKVFRDDELELCLRTPILNRDLIDKIIDGLKKSRNEYLIRQPVMKIIDILDRAARLWLDPDYPLRKLALRTIPLITGLSKEMVKRSIEVEQLSSRRDDILRALESEISNPYLLDDFQPSKISGRYSRCFGPELIVSIFSGNIPALPHLSIMRSLLIKSACLGKVASGEPIYAVLYAETIREIDPEISQAIAILNWKGGEKKIEGPIFSQADAVIAYGSKQSCNAIRKNLPPSVKLIAHSHKIGFGLIGRSALEKESAEELADKVAYDVAMFDQQACLAPHVYFLEEGGALTPLEFSELLARSLDKLEKKLPRGKLTLEEASRINQIRGVYELKEYSQRDVKLFASSGGTYWTVIYEKAEKFIPSCLNRVIRIVPLNDIFEVFNIVKPIAEYLQNVAVAVDENRRWKLFNRLCQLGVSRITTPGNMSTPTMVWHHDGSACIGELVKWCDIEEMNQ